MKLCVLVLALLQASSWTAVAQQGSPAGDALTRADGLYASGEYAAAQSLYASVLASFPADVSAKKGYVLSTEQVALMKRSKQDMQGALAELLGAQKLAAHNARLLYDLAVLEDEMGLLRDADSTASQLQSLTGGDSRTLYLVARIKLDLGELDPAEAAMRAYLKMQPGDATAHYGLGRILQLQQKNDEARAEFAQSLALKPNQTESHFELSDIALKAGQYDDAIAQAVEVLARDPTHAGALTDAGIAYFRKKQDDQALRFLTRAVESGPDYQPAHYYLGLTLARLGRKTDADRELAIATRLADRENQRSAERMRIQQP